MRRPPGRPGHYERPGPRLLRAGRALGHPRPSGVPEDRPRNQSSTFITISEAAGRVIARLRPEQALELKLANRRYRVGGSSFFAVIERWHGEQRCWLPVGPGEEADRVLQALATMQWQPRPANAE